MLRRFPFTFDENLYLKRAFEKFGRCEWVIANLLAGGFSNSPDAAATFDKVYASPPRGVCRFSPPECHLGGFRRAGRGKNLWFLSPAIGYRAIRLGIFLPAQCNQCIARRNCVMYVSSEGVADQFLRSAATLGLIHRRSRPSQNS
jgi:hypothetical protein